MTPWDTGPDEVILQVTKGGRLPASDNLPAPRTHYRSAVTLPSHCELPSFADYLAPIMGCDRAN